jgi:uncharacterized repeat protein (TIGR01451 family)
LTVAVAIGATRHSSIADNSNDDGRSEAARIVEGYGKLPLGFEANRGQTDSEVQFLTRGSSYTLFLTPTEAVLALRKPDGRAGPRQVKNRTLKRPSAIKKREISVLRMRLTGANPQPQVTGLEELPGKVHYLMGNDPQKWHADVPTYRKVRYTRVYDGIDLVYYGHQGRLEYDFVVEAGADPGQIALRCDGADRIEIDGDGHLVLSVAGRVVTWLKPVVYQETDGVHEEIESRYVLKANGHIGFELGPYDPNKVLTIDPAIAYSTFLGGASDELFAAVTVDTAGNAYITGDTSSSDFPKRNPLSGNSNLSGVTDAFITKLGPAGTNILFSTYLGGGGFDTGAGIAIDPSTNIYVTGTTDSGNFTTTASGFQRAPRGANDLFFTKINAAGSSILYSSYLGGTNDQFATGIAVDTNGNAYVTGETISDNFPTKNAFRATLQGESDGFVAKFNPTASGNASLVYSTYLGGEDDDTARAITVDLGGSAYITGSTYSTNFPVTTSAVQTNNPGFLEAVFVTRLGASGSNVVYSTYLGGESSDVGQGIAVDNSTNVYVTGYTSSLNFPVTAGAFQPVHTAGFRNAFVTKINPAAAGSAGLVYSTFLGGADWDEGWAVAVDTNRNVYVAGEARSIDFPTSAGAFQRVFGGGFADAFVAKLNPSAAGPASLVYSSYLGGGDDDVAYGIAVDLAGSAYVVGITISSNDFPRTAGAFQGSSGGFYDAFVTKIVSSADLAVTKSDAPDPVAIGANLTYTLIVTNRGELAASNVVLTDQLPAEVTFVSATPSAGNCMQAGGVVTCNLGGLPNGGAATATIVATAVTPGIVTNTATVSAAQPDASLTNNTATVTTTIGAIITVLVPDPDASEPGTDTGRITLMRSGITQNALTVNYTVGGTATPGADYVALSGSVTFLANSAFANLFITPLDDQIAECDETVMVTVAPGSGYAIGAPDNGTVTIHDNEPQTLTVQATLPDAFEQNTVAGRFTIARCLFNTNTPVIVNYTLGGTATPGADYVTNALTGTIFLPAGVASTNFTVTPVNDTAPECDETVMLTLFPSTAYSIVSSPNATVTIHDNEAQPVSISATVPAVLENSASPGVFTISRCLDRTNTALTVNFSRSGTASNTVDYTISPTTTSVTIPLGAAAANVTVTPINDALVENDETVVLTLTTGTGYAVVAPSAATVTILDDDQPRVNVVASTPAAPEAGPGTGAFTFTRNAIGDTDLTVNFTVVGTAVAGTDYTPLPGSVTIPAGTNAVTLAVMPINNNTLECDRTVQITISSAAGYLIDPPGTATVTIVDDELPTVNIVATTPTAVEFGAVPGGFTVSRDCTRGALAVNYTITGTASNGVDYVALSNSVVIPDGSTSTAVTVKPLDDLLPECPETVTLTISPSAAYITGASPTATVTITDNDYNVIVTATDPAAAEPGADTGTFRISHGSCTTLPLPVLYRLSGSATPGVDYQTNALSGSVTIPAGTNAVNLTITAIDDVLIECAETVVLTISNQLAYTVGASSNATVTINDNDVPTVNVAAPDPSAAEAGPDTGLFRFTITTAMWCTNTPLAVNYTLSGTATPGIDYTTNMLTGVAVIPAGTNRVDLTLTPRDDFQPECPETVVLTISSNVNYVVGSPATATVTILDDDKPTVEISESQPNASEFGPTSGLLTIFRNGCFSSNLVVRYTLGGTATRGTDYSTNALSGTATIPAGSAITTLSIPPIDDALAECPETVVVAISNNVNFAYVLGALSTGTVTIADNDSAVTITASDPNASETGPDPGAFTVTRTGCTTVDLNVLYSLSGTAANGIDYEMVPGLVTIPSGTNSVVITVLPIDDTIVEGNETVIATISSNAATYRVGSPASATVTIADNDTHPSLTIASATFTVVTGNGNGFIDPGETVQETVVLQNSGTTPATNVTATISTTAPGVTITQPSSSYPNVAGNGGIATNATPFQYRLAKTITCGAAITFNHVTTTGGLAFSNTFTRMVGQEIITVVTNSFESTDVSKTIASGQTRLSTNVVSLAGTNVIDDVNVSVRMNSTRDGSITIAIQHPDGTEVILSDRRGGTGTNFGTGNCASNTHVRTVFDDQAATPISSGTAPFAGAFQPDGPLSNLNSKAVSGIWRLRVTAVSSPTSTSTLTCWGLQIASHPVQFNCSVFNNPPVASNQAVTVTANTATNLVLKGSDLDGDTISFRTNSLPAHGVLSNFNPSTGAITYTAMQGFAGTDGFTFIVNDGTADSSAGTVSVTVLDVDSDGDGLPDSWEVEHGFDPNNPNDAGQDADGDGMTNLEEFIAATDPRNPASVLRILSVAISGADCVISFNTAPNKLYLLERKSGMVGAAPVTVAENIVGTGDTVQVIDPGGATQPAQFYRIKVQQ